MSIKSVAEVILSELNQPFISEPHRLDKLRLTIEPYIYNYLSVNYYSKLQEHWVNYKPPKNSKNVFAIIERRCHPNFDFVLKNIAWANPNMAVYIFCSDENENYIKALLRDKNEYVTLVKAFTGSVSRDQGKIDYNNLLTSTKMYEAFDKSVEYLLTIQMDVFIRRAVTDDMFVGGYWGNPWAWKPNTPGGGGATIRKISTMIDICSKYKYIDGGEDTWFATHIQEYNYGFPDIDFRAMRIMESIYVMNPVVVHQFWTYLDQLKNISFNDLEEYLQDILSLDID
jgi:hypothetical protein